MVRVVWALGLLAACGLTATPAMAAVGGPGVAVPLYGLDHACQDARYPALAGPWVVACGPDGRVDRALSLLTGVEVSLPIRPISPGLGEGSPGLDEGLLLAVGDPAGLVRLSPQGATLADLPRIHTPVTAPPATDGRRGALVAEDRVSAWPLEAASRVTHAARPVGWYPPALAGTLLAWVEDGGVDGEDVWALDLAAAKAADKASGEAAAPRPLAAGPGHQRHVVASGTTMAWVEPGALVVLDTVSGERRRLPVDTGFSAPPALWRDVACWEERPAAGAEGEANGVDIRCSDGVTAEGPGHQRWPSRYGPWLLYREGDQPWLRTAPTALESTPEEAP